MEFKTSKKLNKWMKNHMEQACRFYETPKEQFMLTFSSTGIVECQTAKCLYCGEEITDYVGYMED